MNTELLTPMTFDIDKTGFLCQNSGHDPQTQMATVFGADLVTNGKVGSNLCPDEKGTERLYLKHKNYSDAASVATYAPMKRGLKGVDCLLRISSTRVATYAPMKGD